MKYSNLLTMLLSIFNREKPVKKIGFSFAKLSEKMDDTANGIISRAAWPAFAKAYYFNIDGKRQFYVKGENGFELALFTDADMRATDWILLKAESPIESFEMINQNLETK